MSDAADRLRGWWWLILLAAVLGALAFPLIPTFNDAAPPMDEGLLIVEPEQVLDGSLPNRDFESFYGPANTYVLAGVYAVAGPGVTQERVVGLLYRLALIAAVFALAWAGGMWVAVIAGLLCGALTFGLGLAASAYFGGLAIGVWAVFLLLRGPDAARRSELLVVGAGIAAGLSVSYRPQFGVALALAAVPLLARREGVVRPLLAGTVIGLLPLAIHAVLAGPGTVFENLVIDSLIKSAPQSNFPFPPKLGEEQRLAIICGAALVLLTIMGAVCWRRNPGGLRERAVAAGALFCLGLAPQAIGRLDSPHMIEVGCVALPLLPLAFVTSAGRNRPWLGASGALASAVVVVAMTWNYVQPMFPSYERSKLVVRGVQDTLRDSARAQVGSRSFPLATADEAREAEQTVAAVEQYAQPGDRIVVGPQDLRQTIYADTYLYHLLPDLTPGTYYLSETPGTANGEGTKLPGDIADADIVVLGIAPAAQAIVPGTVIGDNDAIYALADHFCMVAALEIHRVYVRCR